MLNTVIGWVANIAVGKQLVQAVAWVHNALDGHRSEITLGSLALIHALKIAGVIPAATADAVEKSLAAVLPVVLADKASKVLAVVDKVVPAAPVNDSPEPPKA